MTITCIFQFIYNHEIRYDRYKEVVYINLEF